MEYDTLTRDTYEVIVIGSGLGGLAAAAVLASQGLDVLVIERSFKPGGLCSSFKMDGHVFDAATSRFQGLGELGFNPVRKIFDLLGEHLEITTLDTDYSIRFGDKFIRIYSDFHTYTSELAALFPEEAGSIHAFLREMEHIYAKVLERSGPPPPRSDESILNRAWFFLNHPSLSISTSRSSKRNVSSLFDRYSLSPDARRFFQADLFLTTGSAPFNLPTTTACLALMNRHFGSSQYPLGGAQRIADRLEKTICERGGEFLYKTGVDEIIIDSGRARGVRLSDGRTVFSEAVISGIPYERFIKENGELEKGPTGLSAGNKNARGERGFFAIYLSVPAELIPESFDPHTVLVENPLKEPPDYVMISIPSLVDYSLAPEGSHSVSILSTTDIDRWRSLSNLANERERYEREKERESARILESIETILPGITSSCDIKATASPLTFLKYAGRPGKYFAPPPECAPDEPVSARGTRTPIKGLFLAGASTFLGDGAAPAVASGIRASSFALEYLERKQPLFEPPRESFVIETVPVRREIATGRVIDTMSAVLESQRCLYCEDGPCARACPLGIDIPCALRRLSSGNITGAARKIREKNPFGESCGVVCPTHELCESACVRKDVDSALKISQMEKFFCSARRGMEGWPRLVLLYRKDKVAVIGSGPAGATCAYFLSMLGYKVEVIESEISAGGLPAQVMPSFLLDPASLENDLEGALAAGVDFRGNMKFGEDIGLESLWREGFKAIFIGVGRRQNSCLEIPGADLPGVIDSLSFLAAAKKRVKREVTARIGVYGDGSEAFYAALTAKELGAERVFLVTSWDSAKIKETPYHAILKEKGIETVPRSEIVEIRGEERVGEVVLASRRGDADEETSEPKNETVTKSPTASLEVETLVNASRRKIEQPLGVYLASHLSIRTDGTISVDSETLMTSLGGVFAGGDVVGSFGVARACAHGRQAAFSIDRYLSERR